MMRLCAVASPITSSIPRCLLVSQSIIAVNSEIQTSFLTCKYSNVMHNSKYNVMHNSSLTFAKVTWKIAFSFRDRISPLSFSVHVHVPGLRYLFHTRMTVFSVKHMKPGRESS